MTDSSGQIRPVISERNRYKGKLNPLFREKAIALVRSGSPPRTALKSLGCSERTTRSWEEQGKDPENPTRFGLFYLELQAFEQEWLARIAANATKLSERDIRGAVDMLGRRDPDHWGRKDTVDVNVQIDAGPTLKLLAEAQQKMLSGEYRVLAEDES